MNRALIDEVVDLLRALRLPHMRAAAPDLLATAKTQRWDPAEAVKALLTEELAGRQASSVRARRKGAGFPTGKTFEAWDETVSSIPAPTPRALRTLEWIDRHENLVICGPSSTAKTHFCEALGHTAVDAGQKITGSAPSTSARSCVATTSPTASNSPTTSRHSGRHTTRSAPTKPSTRHRP